MKYKLATTLLVVAALVVATFSAATTTPPALAAKPTTTTSPPPADSTFPVDGCPSGDPRPAPPCTDDDVILRWNEQLLATIRANPGGTGPTVASRALGVLHTATYDAWAAYSPAKATLQNGNTEQALSSDPAVNDANKSKAISFAAYKTLVNLFPSRKSTFYDPQMIALYGSNFDSDSSAPATVGKNAADAVIADRRTDGSNQTLNPDNTVSYPYPCQIAPECYNPNNHNKWNDVNTPWHWQPLCVLTPAGVAANQPPVRDPNSTCPDTPPPTTPPTPPNYTVQRPLTPQWGNITPFATSPASIIVTGPPKNVDGTYSNADVVTALNDTSNLDDVKKTKAEYWADGPGSVFPPGHMAVFAQTLSRKNHFTLDKDVQLFFALGNAVMDAGIAAWWQKYKWDFWRPVTAIRHLYEGQQVTSWLGPGPGPDFGLVDGKDWMPYQALNVVTPGFPEYVSGHSSFSAAGAYILTNFTSSDRFGGRITIGAHSSAIEPGTPAAPVTLTWPTFSEAGAEAGMSRRIGGIHFYSGDIHGRQLGDIVGRAVWSKVQAYLQGKIGY
jgi:hypothetical protein